MFESVKMLRLDWKQIGTTLTLLELMSGVIGFSGVGNTVCGGVFFSRIQAFFFVVGQGVRFGLPRDGWGITLLRI